ncbi:MAG: rhamnan synthesis F family protein [Tabrizicola sp.]|uniref:rhamnan synthesis F family protein n=1 Tax=Tabrizicola sp. TaxID=2005166 RepID=UPI002ABBEC64|nr:rhamnan synthesis F family protein [Tabrizicola sp.]MDZ4089374.1 rhamnan synthesis F family protein [Tabrizicola sp.]
MPFPPAWKIRREILRVCVKVGLATARWIYEPVRKIVYDRTALKRQRLTKGAFPLTDRVAVFVVFQPRGVPASVHFTVDHLRQNGFSVLVVSNGQLRLEDRATLAERASLVLERPNVGYDFGGYRDGIRYLWSLNHSLSRLVLMNDSTWFPLRSSDDSLARMEALGADLAGHIYKIEDEADRYQDHVESHLLMISRDFFNSEEFRRFWTDYRMSDFRSTTIGYGEKGFTQMALRSCRDVATLMSREWLLSTLRGLDEVHVRTVLDHTIDTFKGSQKDASDVRRALAQRERWRETFLDWVERALSNSRSFLISATFIMPALVYGGMGFAKKARDLRFHLARKKLLDLEERGMISPIDSVVRHEIIAAVRSWQPPSDWKTNPHEASKAEQ